MAALNEVIPLKIIDSLIKNMAPATAQTASQMTVGKPSEGPVKPVESQETVSEGGKIVAELKAQGYEISEDEADRISEFIDKSDGTESEKLQTVKTALDKGLPLTLRSLKSIQAALFRETLPQELRTLAEAAGFEVSMGRVELIRAFSKLASAEAAAENPGQSEGKADVADSANRLLETTRELNATAASNAAKGGTAMTASAREAAVLMWLMEALEQVAVLSEALVGAEDVEKTEGEEIRPSNLEAYEKRPTGHPEEKYPSDTKAESSVKIKTAEGEDVETDRTSRLAAAVEQVISALGEERNIDVGPSEALIQGMTLLMKEITPRMAEVKMEFEALRKAVKADLAAVRTELEKPAAPDRPKVVEKLTKAIEKLDKAILKSDIPLYTSMKAEKQLLKWSSELQEARSLVSGGKNAEASAIVTRVEKGLAEIQFQPARLKVIHRTLQQTATGDDFREKGLQQRAQEQVSRILEPVQTPREVLEAFKALGLTHESEVVSVLGQGNKKLKEEWLPQENLKEILMKLASETEEKLTTVTGTEKALNNLTGQQLLSRPEAKPQGQTMFFSMPMELGNRVEDLKIYVQSRKDNGKVDWENCTFYFAVHTEKYGDVGIRFAAARKSVSIQVKCDNEALRNAVSPMVEDFKKAMWETGYKIAGISYSPLKDTKISVQKPVENTEPEAEGKGLNIKV